MRKPLADCDHRNRCGFSLVELLIVLAVLVTLATLTLPALRGPMDKARLRGAGREMESAIAKTRSLAIRTGEAHWFVFEPEGRLWRIETNAGPIASDDQAATASGLTAEGPQLPDQQAIVVRAGQLPAGVMFAEPPDAELQTQTELTDVLIESGPSWSEPIHFSPIGRTSNREFLINGARDFDMQIKIRGLTGAVTASLQRRIELTPEEELLNSETDLTEPTTEQLR